MWGNYEKNFIFRDCFDGEAVEGRVSAIQKLLYTEQTDKSFGTIIATDVLSVSTIANDFSAYKSEDDGTWNLVFYNADKEICIVSLWDCKEIHLCFEIEEDIKTGKFKIHYCTVKGFNEYQK